MVNYKKLGFNTLEEYNKEFLNTLLKTNQTYDFFVDWEKVFNKIEDSLIEIQILNSLNKVKDGEIVPAFEKIIHNYPEVVPILPLILAIRDKDITILDLDNGTYKNFNFTTEKHNNSEIVFFAEKTGLLKLFSKIDDLYTYLVGLEVGLDSNARKNRSGHIFENIVEECLKNNIKNLKDYHLEKEVTIPFIRNKRWDFVIYKNNKPQIFVECNFYNSTGSKPIETANAYVDLQQQIMEEYTFLWVTDGKGWEKMFTNLQKTYHGIKYILNYKMLNRHIKQFLD